MNVSYVVSFDKVEYSLKSTVLVVVVDSLVQCEEGMEMRMSCNRSFRGVLAVGSETIIPFGS